jgi:quinol monooxygenase YgiN
MAIAVIGSIPDKETYETLSEQMFGTKRGPTPDGCLVHSAGEGPNGFCVVDIWESQEAFDSFMNERLMPAMQEAGMGDMASTATPPEIVELIHVTVNDEVRV